MTELEQLQIPPTENEIDGLMNALIEITPTGTMILRRLIFQRDQLIEGSDLVNENIGTLLRFESRSRFEINGNDCFPVKLGHDCFNFDHLIGQEVFINGVKRKVIGVEFFAHSAPWSKDEGVALMCETEKG